MIVLAFFIDAVLTVLVAIGTSWFYTSRYLVRRTSDHMGKGDLEIYRRAIMVLVQLQTHDRLAPFGWVAETKAEIEKIITAYNKTKETL